MSPFQAAYGTEFYPTIANKIPIHAIITTHAFVDANKRTAVALGLAVAEANGQRVRPLEDQEIEDLAVSVADHTYAIPDIAEWLMFYFRFYSPDITLQTLSGFLHSFLREACQIAPFTWINSNERGQWSLKS